MRTFLNLKHVISMGELISYIKKNWSGVHFSLDGSLLLIVQIKSGFDVLSLINITACLSSKNEAS